MKKLYKYSGKCDYQQKYKAIIEASMVYTPEVLKDNIPMNVGTFITMNNPRVRNFLSKFLDLLYAKQKNTILRMGATKKNRKAIRTSSD